jgi:catechol 2,3-dioxygenase-like lactoylglutathione lyase family enzyme
MDSALDTRSESLATSGLGCLVVPVTDAARAKDFYHYVLGFREVGTDVLPNCGPHALMAAASGQLLALTTDGEALDLRETGVHQAYQVSPAAKDSIARSLATAGVQVLTYKEDRPAEERDNFYFFDPDGNRVQLVAIAGTGSDSGVSGIDHAAIQTADVLWAERFYGDYLGLPIEHRVGWRTEDYVRARRWAAGEEDMAPGARRLDKRYTVMVNKKVVPRANMQLFFKAGASALAVYLANKHFQEPPEEQVVGTPRTVFSASRAVLDAAAALLQRRKWAFEGPVTHPKTVPLAASLYFKDPGGNFLELCTPRKG